LSAEQSPDAADSAQVSTEDGPRRGSLLVIFLTVFVDLLGFGMVLPLLPVYGEHFAEQHGFGKVTVGLVVGALLSSFSLMQFLFVPIWGRLSDRFGRRPILIAGLIGSTLFYTLFGVATAWRSLLGLFLTRIGAGIAGATIATAQAYIADSTTKEKRNKGMALIGAAFALGFTLGPSLGAVSLLAGGDLNFSPWPGYVAGGFSGIALLMAIFLLPESLRPGSQAATHKVFDGAALRSALATPSIVLLLLTSFIAIFSFANFESTLSRQVGQLVVQQPEAVASIVAWAKARGYDDPNHVKLIVILVVFAYLGVVLTLAQGLLVRRLAGKVSESRLAMTGGGLAVVGFGLLALAATYYSFPMLLVAMAVEVIGFAMVNPSLQSLISRRSDPALQGGILGLSQSAASLARILGPLFGNLLFPFWIALPYLAAAALMVVAVGCMATAARRGRDFQA
jgi:MFS transporter, DHA1 family, tetracycline resistance protein